MMKLHLMFTVTRDRFEDLVISDGKLAIERSIMAALARHGIRLSCSILNGEIHLLDSVGVVQFTGPIPTLTDEFIIAWDTRDFRLTDDTDGNLAGYMSLRGYNDAPMVALIGFADEVHFQSY